MFEEESEGGSGLVRHVELDCGWYAAQVTTGPPNADQEAKSVRENWGAFVPCL